MAKPKKQAKKMQKRAMPMKAPMPAKQMPMRPMMPDALAMPPAMNFTKKR